MRMALALWHCLSEEAQNTLRQIAESNGEEFTIPPKQWQEWDPEQKAEVQVIPDDVDYAEIMRQAPSRSRG